MSAGRERPSSQASASSTLRSNPASPPYENSNMPPIYASTSHVALNEQQQAQQEAEQDDELRANAAYAAAVAVLGHETEEPSRAQEHHSYPPDNKSKPTSPLSRQAILSTVPNSHSSSASNSRPGTAGPRVAIRDPIADYRERGISHPEGLGPRSDFPTLENSRIPEGVFKFDTNNSSRPSLLRRDSDVSSEGDRDYDNFDWSDEEDIEEAARFENEQAEQYRMGRLSVWKILNFLATTFFGNLIIACSLIVPVIVIQFVYRKNGPNEGHRDFVADNVQAWFIWAAFNLHVEWWLHVLVELFPRAVLGAIQLIWGRPSQKVLSLAEYFNAIKGYIKGVLYAALFWGSWAIIFNSIYGLYNRNDPTASRAGYLNRIYQVVEFFFFLVLTVSAEKIVIKHIAMSFHRSAYADRIAQVTKSLKVFDWLRDHKPKMKGRDYVSAFGFPMPRSGRATPSMSGAATPVAPLDFDLADDEAPGDTSNSSSKNNNNNKGSWLKKHSKKRPSDQHEQISMPLQAIDPKTGKPSSGTLPSRGNGRSRLIARAAERGGRSVRATASQASTLARVAMRDPFGLLRNEALGIGTDINSPSEAKRLARSIFIAFKGSHKRSYLIPSDFDIAYKNTEDAKDAFSVFDRDGNGDISQTEIKNTVMQVFKERRFLSRSMQDVNHAVGQLDGILLVVALIVVMFEALAIFQIDIGKTLTTFYSLAIAFAFVFKSSAANVFDSIIFLFITHPFDTGDRIQIAEQVFVVKRMSLLSCLFVNDLNQDVYISNIILAATTIVNMRRSGYMWESITAQFDFNTPLEKLDALEADMIHWLQTEPERLFVPSTAVVPQTIDYMRSIECTIGMTHADTWQDWGRRFYRRNAFFAAFSYYCKKHGIRYANAVQPVVYWADDAAAQPPSYETGQDQHDSEDEEDNGYVQDDFAPSPVQSPSAAGSISMPLRKHKTFMNFTPPVDDLENDRSHVRLRKVKHGDKMVTMQGGEG